VRNCEVEGLKISDESVRSDDLEGLWKARKVRKLVVHQMRERRACFEDYQIDGSPYAWFEEDASVLHAAGAGLMMRLENSWDCCW